ncbi:hypothetical protein PtrSN002B_001800 [Pyrenophora tritici-repentis]|uniref:Uncharacterized protein n=2 Tax=Pyrenophora tritici-repentis TaxID=45151 RepID=A0A2W1E050_9PLEO|nr:uncharacterized protein PTRG_01913 [Pyrenophora tritici-repentis Pt-1C-BFP]KAA8626620.1 hypothetical protein PtrV1_02300 [Pyrenophora tritici-repentis]EDU41351.1 predicted protein [Pyrenophora tritici-repentis Pt-1C-BFP]KAF7455050.1 hypothetical protein A1F99_023080 [Pyrenophora tritici-repentis]KAF7578208.1 hypothetical protein PtrM4_024480 [Pyrenophora tritici-repentis]KAI0573100.1 hypothetical protein Alg215_09388 [Pyrenophora tritici-repentis]
MKSLTIRCTTKLKDHLGYFDPLSSLLGQFPNVKSLVVKYTPWSEEAVWVERDPCNQQYTGIFKMEKKGMIRGPGIHFSHFTDELITIAPQLEYLELVCPGTEHSGHPSFRAPLRTLQQFTQLKRLCIPQGAFTLRTYGEPFHIYRIASSPLDVLPPTLEYLCMSHPSYHIIAWLGDILRYRDLLPNVKLVEMDLSDGTPDVASDYDDEMRKIGFALYNAGIDIRVKK